MRELEQEGQGRRGAVGFGSACVQRAPSLLVLEAPVGANFVVLCIARPVDVEMAGPYGSASAE